ncbi:MAG TPA: nucleotide sugar dehydrogenase, partial [Candidatus Omnitrophica bacterium]|nr:nucleotide sugar dehydrogenase [Candidatus Omnitrophota bacterium]
MLNKLKSKIINKDAHIGIIGLGYVGLPLAVEFAKVGFNVTGFDTDGEKVSEINKGSSYILDVPAAEVKQLISSKKLSATKDKRLLNKMDAIIICVPTPLRKTKEPDISFILAATEDIAANIRKGQLIILESTTYPGTTEEVILTRLGADSLKVGEDFCLAFSPERVDPGNPKYKTKDIPKVVGGVGEKCTEMARLLYSQIIKNVITVSSTRSAEMVKLLENTFRAVNIGLINELALLCNKMNLDIWEIIEAARTKPFGFMPFYPGPGLGGHCLSEKETIIMKSSSCINVSAIKEVFCALKETPEIKKMYYKNILFLFPKDLQVLSFDSMTNSMCFKKIHCLTEREYNGESLEIKTKDGRCIT